MSATFRMDVAAPVLVGFLAYAEHAGWDVVDREQEFEGFHRFTVTAQDAPADAEGKVISPVFSRDAEGWVTVQSWGVPS